MKKYPRVKSELFIRWNISRDELKIHQMDPWSLLLLSIPGRIWMNPTYQGINIYIDILYICIYNSHFLSKTQGTTSVMALATCQATQRSLRLFWGVTLWMVSPDHEDPWRPKGILYVFLERMMFLMAYLPDLYHKGQRKNVGVGYGGFFFGGCLSLDAFRGFFSPLIPETWMMILLIEENVAPPNIYETL